MITSYCVAGLSVGWSYSSERSLSQRIEPSTAGERCSLLATDSRSTAWSKVIFTGATVGTFWAPRSGE